MEWKSFFPSFLAAIAALIIALIILKTMHWAKKRKQGGGGNNYMPGAQQPGQMIPGQQQSAIPLSFAATNSIPQQNMPINYVPPQ